MKRTFAGSRWSSALWWTLVALLFCLPLFVGLGRTDLQNDEAIYSYAVQSILETGDWLNPRLSPDPEAVFLEKPPLKFWIVALPIRARLLPNDEFGLRFWDAVLGSGVFLYVFAIGRRLAGPFCGLIAGLVLFSFSPLLFDHGLRSNNMEAALTLAYCGGVYHFLRWADGGIPGRVKDDRIRAFAVGAYCLLGFMTKFVAVVFLPVALLAATAVTPATRRRLLDEWRLWVGVAGLALALAAPWFVYQSVQGRAVWAVIFQEHVVRRMTASLDPSHVHPWHYYFTYLFAVLRAAGAASIVIAGSLLLLVRTLRTRWIDGTLLLAWFIVPVALISTGTSKLGHYLYPYLPPVALAAGFLMASLLRLSSDIAATRWSAWLPREVTGAPTVPRWRQAAGSIRLRLGEWLSSGWTWWVLTGLRAALGVLAAAWLALAVMALAHPGRVEIAGITVARNPIPLRLALNALVAGLVAGYGRRAPRAALAVLLIALSPVAPYRATIPRLMVQDHPRRDARDCLARVERTLPAQGRAQTSLFVYEPNDFTHPDFFYLRSFGWAWHGALSEEEFRSLVDGRGEERLALISRSAFDERWQRLGAAGRRSPERIAFGSVLLLLPPGRFAACAD